ncbi:helix-turn-helix domain-containing protein [uncultured Winogradskyella sp.]|uniref:helix-turn-helix domain-containing protein n=1 Tax=uncultured Winogradskyella sp. TaxID=395353 RepID=UPI00261F8528|nr:helix-turn-helix domain-containing protein [uncultured Winogradskyella sp.]
MDATQALLLANIKRIRKEKGLTQQDVADSSDMLVPTYSRLERGGSNPSLASMIRIANALDVSLIELLSTTEIKDRSIAQKLEMINDLSDYNKNVVNILLDSMIEKDRVEKFQNVKMKNRLAELAKVRGK